MKNDNKNILDLHIKHKLSSQNVAFMDKILNCTSTIKILSPFFTLLFYWWDFTHFHVTEVVCRIILRRVNPEYVLLYCRSEGSLMTHGNYVR